MTFDISTAWVLGLVDEGELEVIEVNQLRRKGGVRLRDTVQPASDRRSYAARPGAADDDIQFQSQRLLISPLRLPAEQNLAVQE